MGVLNGILILAAADLIAKASVTLKDGSVFQLKNSTVNRKVTVKV